MTTSVCAGWLLLTTPARAATNAPAPGQTNSNSAVRHKVRLSQPPPLLPSSALAKSPIAFFRELLAMSAGQRAQALTNRTPQSRELILEKVREYEALAPDERELRLQVTELRWYLMPLMIGPATNRAVQLAVINEPQRRLVEDRLREWDKLTPAEQKRLLENEATARYLTEIERLTDEQRRKMLNGISPARRAALEQGIARWDAMSEEQRRSTLGRFNQFFELTPEEKDKALKTLPEHQRQQVERMLQSFGGLSPEQRAEAIRSLAKFTSLNLAERVQFLKNAERWKEMSPSERQAWRDLVRKLPPPLPLVMPPLPPVPRPARPVPAIVTNGN